MTTSHVIHFVPRRWSGGVACRRADPAVASKQPHVISCEACKRTVAYMQARESV